jgi:hypothetical protein
MGPQRNEGISMSGGRIDAAALAVGRKARAINPTAAAQHALEERGHHEIANRLAALMHLLETHAAQLDNPDELKTTTETIAAELTNDKPNRITVTGLLNGLADGVRSVTSLTTAVDALAKAATALF